MKHILLRNTVALGAALMLAACGFHLRGEASLPFAKISITGNPTWPSVTQLRQAIGKVPRTQLVESPADADVNLQILREEREKVILSLTAAGRVREYEIRLRITYRLIDRKENVLIAPNEILLTRVLSWNETQILAKGDEELILVRDMQSDATQQIMRRLAAAKPG